MKKLFLLPLFFILFSSLAFSQSGMKFAELAKRLEPHFNKEMILDVEKNLPQGGDYSVWGWDVGDYSGDGIKDAAFSVRVASQKGRTMQVYLFVDIDGYFVKAGQFTYEFVDIPLEIGVVIRNNSCYITQKNKLYDWLIRGYRFDSGSLIHLDEFTTKRVNNYTNESYRNFESLKNTEKFLDTRSGRVDFFADYTAIPCYNRGRLIYKGFENEVYVDDINYVPKGAFYYTGAKDLSFVVSSAYDVENLYMTIKVKDDAIVPQYCDTCIADHVEVWFDMTPNKKNKNKFSNISDDVDNLSSQIDSGVYCFTFSPGNFQDIDPSVQISSSDDLEAYQKIASRNVVCVADLADSSYIIKFKIPFILFGIEGDPIGSGEPVEYGATVVVYDYDNEFRPEELTKMTSSVFDPKRRSSYGSILLIPEKKWYGESANIYQGDILKTLVEYGY